MIRQEDRLEIAGDELLRTPLTQEAGGAGAGCHTSTSLAIMMPTSFYRYDAPAFSKMSANSR
jgi:hypothetical protein